MSDPVKETTMDALSALPLDVLYARTAEFGLLDSTQMALPESARLRGVLLTGNDSDTLPFDDDTFCTTR